MTPSAANAAPASTTRNSPLYRSPEQKQFATRIAQHLATGGAPLLLEGAAGLGKTRAYLIPLLATGEPVAVCVPTRALAAQLRLSDDLSVALGTQSVEIFSPRRSFESKTEYELHRQSCRKADLLICTHQAALIDVLADGKLLGLKDRHAVLFDEADQLPDAAALRFDCSIDRFTFKLLGVKPGNSHRQTVEAVIKALLRLEGELDEPALVRAACRAMLDALDESVWYQRVGLDPSGELRLHHQLPARALKRLLTHPRLTFVSATLTINGSFDDFKRALGLKETSPWTTAIEPLQHGHLDVVSEAWDKNSPDHLTKVAANVSALQGAVLVIVTSHADAELLGGLIPHATVRCTNASSGQLESTGEAAARMEATGGNVLVAAGAWAGLDTPTAWRHVVMPKAPYGQPTVLDEHEVSRYVDSRNAAVRRFRQGLARGLRRPDAVCTLHLLDARFDRAEFINALPTRFAPAYKARFGTVELRTRQTEFRKRIFEQFAGRCAISGCDEPAVLEAAHLGAKGGWRTNHRDGILLRSDLHRLMDAGKLLIVEGVVSVTHPHFRQFDGVRVW
jgi:Rad3-related DNA helicase